MEQLLQMPGMSFWTSRKMADELEGISDEYRASHTEIYEALKKVPFVADGFQPQPTTNSQQSRVLGILPHPKVVKIESVIRGPRNQRPVDRADAQHLFQALEHGVDYFVTLDERTILRARDDIEAAYGIRLRRPSELLQELGID